MADVPVVVLNAPELAQIPPQFYARVVEFMRTGRDGSVTWHFSRGRATKVQATDYITATKCIDTDRLIDP